MSCGPWGHIWTTGGTTALDGLHCDCGTKIWGDDAIDELTQLRAEHEVAQAQLVAQAEELNAIADAIYQASGMRSNHLLSDVTSLIRVQRAQAEEIQKLRVLAYLDPVLQGRTWHGAFLVASNDLQAAEAALAQRTAEREQLAVAISPTHGTAWATTDLATLAQAHRQDSEDVDGIWEPDGETDYDSLRLKREQQLTEARIALEALTAKINALPRYVETDVRGYPSTWDWIAVEDLDVILDGLAAILSRPHGDRA